MPEAEDPDAEAAAAAKRQGDEAFVAARFPAAVEAYTRALRHDTGSHALWANRSAALLRTGDHRAALADARIARTLAPGFTKAWLASRSACVSYIWSRYVVQAWHSASSSTHPPRPNLYPVLRPMR